MSTTIKWVDNNSIETAHRIYKSSTYFTKDNLPAPLVELGPDVTEYVDSEGTDGENWYIVSALLNDYEVFSEPFVVGITTIYTHDIFGDGSAVATYSFDGDGSELSATYPATLGSDVAFVEGVNGQAVATDGTETGSVKGLFNESTGDAAYSIWISTATIFSFGVMSFNTFIINDSGNVEVFDNFDGTGATTKYGLDSTAYPTDGTFFHIVISLSAGVPTVYINGVDQEVVSDSTGSRNIQLGGDATTGGALGTILDNTTYHYAANYDQLRIFNRPLTQQEVDTLYQEGANFL